MSPRFDFICIFARDLRRSFRFYHDLIGLRGTIQGDYVEFDHEGIRFGLYDRTAFARLMGLDEDITIGFPTLNLGMALALQVADVDAEYARLVSLGAKGLRPPRDEPWGLRSAYISDPDGTPIELFRWLPGHGPTGAGAQTE